MSESTENLLQLINLYDYLVFKQNLMKELFASKISLETFKIKYSNWEGQLMK